jgi:hypothetical protein
MRKVALFVKGATTLIDEMPAKGSFVALGIFIIHNSKLLYILKHYQ